MCDNCIHKAVCSKFAATGGYVNKCEHYMEIVRCKDCEYCYYSKMLNKMWCGDNVVAPDCFCSNGERRVEE